MKRALRGLRFFLRTGHRDPVAWMTRLWRDTVRGNQMPANIRVRWILSHYVLKSACRVVYRIHPYWGWALLRYTKHIQRPCHDWKFAQELLLPDGTSL